MKKVILALALTIAATSLAGTSFAQKAAIKTNKKEKTAKEYTCPMHPEVVSDKPGNCPKCNMKLEVKKANKK